MHPAQAAINAAERCISALQRGSVISADDLRIICTAAGEPCDLLWHRFRIGWFPADTDAALHELRALINDMRLELPRCSS